MISQTANEQPANEQVSNGGMRSGMGWTATFPAHEFTPTSRTPNGCMICGRVRQHPNHNQETL